MLRRLLKAFERIGTYVFCLVVVIFHALVLWDVGNFILEEPNWEPRHDPKVGAHVATALRKIQFIEKQKLSDEFFREELYKRAAEDCAGCGLKPFPGVEKSKAILSALKDPRIRQRHEFWHSLSMLAWILFWTINFLLLMIALQIMSKGAMTYVTAAIFLLPFLTLLYSAISPAGDILNFVGELPKLQGLGKSMFYFSIAFPIIGWPIAIVIGQYKQIERRHVVKGIPSPYNYRPPKERLRSSGGKRR